MRKTIYNVLVAKEYVKARYEKNGLNQDAFGGTSAGDILEGLGAIPTGKILPRERRSVRETLATKGRTKGMPGAEYRKREEQLPVSEQQAKRNRRRAR